MAKNENVNMGINGDVVDDIIECDAHEIYVPDGRFRPLNTKKVKVIAESIQKQSRQLQPILIDKNGNLIDGNHRLHACISLGITVKCVVVDEYNNDKLSLMEIDSNLCRAELTDTQLENHLAERKRLYTILYPDTAKRGAKGAESSGKKAFAEDTADMMGKSTRTVERIVKRGEEACEELQEARDNKEITTADVDNILKEAGTNSEEQLDRMKAVIQAKADKKLVKKEEAPSKAQSQMTEQADKLDELIRDATELQKVNAELQDKYKKKSEALKKANETVKNLKERIARAKEANPDLKI